MVLVKLFQMSAAKISTNLTRMAVAKNPHAKLASIYSKNLRVLGNTIFKKLLFLK